MIGVGGIQEDGSRWQDSASFGSNYGVGLDLVAPAKDILVTDRVGAAGLDPSDYFTISGTSFATPMAAGVAALVLAARPSLDAEDVEHILRSSAVDLGAAGKDIEFGYGLVNSASALQMAANYIFWDGFEPGSSARWSSHLP